MLRPVSAARGRRRVVRRLVATLLAAAWAALPSSCAAADEAPPAAAPLAATRPVVVLLSLDGVRHDYPERGGLPAFARMMREGARAEALVPVFPSTTFPNHVSLATGTYPDRHGIVANRFLDPELGEFDYGNDARFLDAEPLWAAAERQGVRAAVFFWVGSETDWRGVGASHRKAPFDSAVRERDKVEQILAWLDLPEPERPGLVMSWWHGADSMGHRFGPDAAPTMRQLRGQDAELLRLIEALDARDAFAFTTLLVVSDHGMIAVTETLDAGAVLEAAGIRARVLQGGAYAHVHLHDPGEREAAVAALAAVPGVSAMAAEEIPEALRCRHPTRNGHVVAFTDPPRMLSRASGNLARWTRVRAAVGSAVGTHGYDPAVHPEMDGILLAMGRGVAPGARLGRVRAIDVAPTAARLLGIAPPRHAEGTPIAGLGEATPGSETARRTGAGR
jgi:predicted AlkP superfamily pyrophosphatase or phosphodiesterase